VAYAQRRELITRLEEIRGSRVLCYFMSDRLTHPAGLPFNTQLGNEAQLFFIDKLRTIGSARNLDLFLYTRGGDINAVWPLVSLLREHCEHLTVIVPFRAHSAGTLICLGADEILLTGRSELSPIDPTTGNQFNPADPANPHNRFGISVEDVSAYFNLSKTTGIEQEPFRVEIFKELTRMVHPLALGNVQRVTLQIRELARRLLALHMNEETDTVKIDGIINSLTVKFYSHLHAITRKEAIRLLGDWVHLPTDEEEPVIWDLFNSYAEVLELRKTFSVPEVMGDTQTRDTLINAGFIENGESSHIYSTLIRIIQRNNLPPGVQLQVPPGGAIPLLPWATRAYDFDIKQTGWKVNEEEI
jgi:hypothetical protein